MGVNNGNMDMSESAIDLKDRSRTPIQPFE